MKRLQSAKENGMKIAVRKYAGYNLVGILVINEEDQKEQKKELTSLKRKYTRLLKDEKVIEFLNIKAKLFILTNGADL